MQQKTEDRGVKRDTQFVLNYHKHPNTGGVGHVSMTGFYNGKEVKLSVYPTEDLSLLTPLAVVSMFVFPITADNHTSSSKTDSPIHASYDITNMVSNPGEALDEMEKIGELIASGRASFSLTPNLLTQSLTALLNKNSSTSNMLLGMKVLDRRVIEAEVDKVTVVNCAESISRVLEKGGIERPSGLMGYATPSGINEFFASNPLSSEPLMLLEGQMLVEDTDTAPLQSQMSLTKPELGFFSSLFQSVKDFFHNPLVSTASTELKDEGSDAAHDWSTRGILSGLELKDTDIVLAASSETKEPASREEATSSPRASEYSESFFAASTDTILVTAQNENESDLDYCSRVDAMIN